jgi:hypothetical protein
MTVRLDGHTWGIRRRCQTATAMRIMANWNQRRQSGVNVKVEDDNI